MFQRTPLNMNCVQTSLDSFNLIKNVSASTVKMLTQTLAL